FHSRSRRPPDLLQTASAPARATISFRPAHALTHPPEPTMHIRLITRIAAAAIALSAAAPAFADQWSDVQQRKEIRCATFADVPPFAAPDPKTREMVGFDVELCNAIAKQLGVKATVVPVSVEARVPEVKMGRVDITVANLAYTLSRAA